MWGKFIQSLHVKENKGNRSKVAFLMVSSVIYACCLVTCYIPFFFNFFSKTGFLCIALAVLEFSL